MTMDPKFEPATPWPRGYRQLSTAEAVEAILLGTCKGTRNYQNDAALVQLLREGKAVAALGPDRELRYKASKYGMAQRVEDQAELAELKDRQAELVDKIAEAEAYLQELKGGENDNTGPEEDTSTSMA